MYNFHRLKTSPKSDSKCYRYEIFGIYVSKIHSRFWTNVSFSVILHNF